MPMPDSVKMPNGPSRGSRYTGNERRLGPYRPMSVGSFVTHISLFITIATLVAGGSWWLSKVESRVAANETDIAANTTAFARIAETISSLDTVIQRVSTNEGELREQRAQTALLQDMRTNIAVLVSEFAILKADVAAIKNDRLRDRREREQPPR